MYTFKHYSNLQLMFMTVPNNIPVHQKSIWFDEWYRECKRRRLLIPDICYQ
jgi:hypothetical protein